MFRDLLFHLLSGRGPQPRRSELAGRVSFVTFLTLWIPICPWEDCHCGDFSMRTGLNITFSITPSGVYDHVSCLLFDICSDLLEFDMIVNHNYLSMGSAHHIEIHIFSNKYFRYHSLTSWTLYKPLISQESWGILIKVWTIPYTKNMEAFVDDVYRNLI